MERGPVDFVVCEFPNRLPGRTIGAALRELAAEGVINVIDILIVEKDVEGVVRTFEAADRPDDPEIAALAQVAQSVDGLISEQDVADIAAGLALGSTSVVALFEHRWAAAISDVVARAGGEIALFERVPGEVVDAVERVAAGAHG